MRKPDLERVESFKAHNPSTPGEIKFWQLGNVLLPGEEAMMRRVAAGKRDWRHFAQWMDDNERLVLVQDREKLDSILPVAFARAVLRKSARKFYLSQGCILRSRRRSLFDRRQSALKAFDRYGGTAMEDALEYGSFYV